MCRDALFLDPEDASYISDEQLQQRIARIGCVPRHLFGEDGNFDEIITDALEETDRSVQQLLVSVIDNTAIKESHRLLFRDALPTAPFKKRELRWASPYVIECVLEKLRSSLGQTMQHYLDLRVRAGMRTATGSLFQVLAAPILCGGGFFDWRPLVAATEQTLSWQKLALPSVADDRVRLYESPRDLARVTVGDSPIYFDTKPGQAAFDAILVFTENDNLQFFFVQYSLSIGHDLKGKAFVDALAVVPANSKVHYLRVSDAFVDKLQKGQKGERRITNIEDISKKDKLYFWYSEIIEVLNGNKDAPSRQVDRQGKLTENANEPEFTEEKRGPLDAFLLCVRDFAYTQEEMRIDVPNNLPFSSSPLRLDLENDSDLENDRDENDDTERN